MAKDNKEKKRGSLRDWLEQRREAKIRKEDMKLLELRLNTADGLFEAGMNNVRRGTRADMEQALLCF